MTADRSPLSALVDELRTILASLGHARQTLQDVEAAELAAFKLRVDRCAAKVEALDGVDRERVRPIMLALLDELERTIAAFDAERRRLGDRLKSTSRNAAAGAAYRQARMR